MPRWTQDDLRAFEERRRIRRGEVERTVAVMEPTPRNDVARAAPVQEADDERIVVRVISTRSRLLDEDNLAEKYLVDALRYAGLLAEDCPEKVKIEVSQRKCREGEEEHVIIEITSP